MYREKIKELQLWKESPQRKPLIIKGARQVGKTWLIKEFGKTSYRQYAYINFEKTSSLKDIFLPDLEPKRIVSIVELATGLTITPEDTLIIFDEIQTAKRGLTSLKYFCEEAPEYHVIAAGSMLGIALHEDDPFPVGKVSFLDLYPLSFREFLIAMDENSLADALKQQQWDSLCYFTEKLKEYLRFYLYVGGMPEVVAEFAKTRNWNNVRSLQLAIIQTYENDFSKHAPLEIVPRIRMVWQNIPAQLSKENKKYVYGALRQGARAKDFEIAIQWLLDCGLLLKNPQISKPSFPLTAYCNFSTFKLYLNDVGLLGALAGLAARTIIEGDAIFTEFKGALTEQYVMQQLRLNSQRLISYYSNDRNTAEVDFVIQDGSEIIPIEVKANENVKAKSFKQFCEKFNPTRAIRTSLTNYKPESWMTNVPLYAIENI